MCMSQMMHDCNCHEECDCTPEEKIRSLELTKEFMQARIKKIDRKIGQLKEKSKATGS